MGTVIDERDVDDVEIVAQASGLKGGDLRWTVLSLYYDAKLPGVGGEPFIAEIVGETLIQGEQRRVKRARFTTVAKALNWREFNAKTTLFNELRRKSIDWMEAFAHRSGSVYAERELERIAKIEPGDHVARTPASVAGVGKAQHVTTPVGTFKIEQWAEGVRVGDYYVGKAEARDGAFFITELQHASLVDETTATELLRRIVDAGSQNALRLAVEDADAFLMKRGL